MKQVIVNKLKDFFKLQPIEKAWVFGSYSRGEETHESDIERKVLHKDIDLVEEGQLKDFAKDSAERDKILIYERKSLKIKDDYCKSVMGSSHIYAARPRTWILSE